MALLSAANLIAITDKLAAGWNAAAAGIATAIVKAGDYQGIVAGGSGINDISINRHLSASADLLPGKQAAVTSFAPTFQDVFTSLQNGCFAAASVTGSTNQKTAVNDFATYYNKGGGGPWNCLFAPDFYTIFTALPNQQLSAFNTYFEVLQGATYTNALAKWVVTGAGTGTLTPGFAIDGTKYAGGFGQVTVSGFAGSSGVVTVTGTWRKPDGTLSVGNTGTATVAANGTVVLTPPAANYLLVSVSAVAVSAPITGGTIYVEAKRPAGRTNPPS